MRIGLVCPYPLTVPGGVQAHVTELATSLRLCGHQVSVLAPTGRTVSVPYNGSVARLAFGPRSLARVRRWLGDHDFDVLHLHEPVAPSLSMLALMVADGPIVATFHASTARSRTLLAVQGVLRPLLEKITVRVAVSELARRAQADHVGGDAMEIPNGVARSFYAEALPLPGYPRAGGTIGFVGRFDEPRKGMPILLKAVRLLEPDFPDLRVLVVGHGDDDQLRRTCGRVIALGHVDDSLKARALRSVDVLCAPNTGAESFGVVLAEAMSAGTPIVASDLDAFRRVLDDGRAGLLVPPGDPVALAAGLTAVLTGPRLRSTLAAAGRLRVQAFDWPVVAGQVLRAYQTATSSSLGRVGRG
ncbi:MAG: glycosyltransferase family 4 protein [Kutzneria sp.]|nr:glycosyltransferase family 4 protein [Kutzneria sp.]